MTLLKGTHTVDTRTVLALGFFDGIHRGHRAVLDTAEKHARLMECPLQVLTFYPHPQHLVNGSDFRYLTTYGEKFLILRSFYTDCILRFIRFEKTLRDMNPEKFIGFLSSRFQPEAVYIGENFRFGYRARGDAALLRNSLTKENISVEVVATVREEGEAVSSSRIRSLLTRGKLEEANAFLGYPYSIHGVVRKGQKLGSTLGFPTANIYPSSRKLLPGPGVYAGYARGKDFSCPALVYVGTRPTLGGIAYPVTEAYLPGLKQENLYGKRMCFSFVAFMREEVKFSSLEELRKQISCDLGALEPYLQQSSLMIHYNSNVEKMGVS